MLKGLIQVDFSRTTPNNFFSEYSMLVLVNDKKNSTDVAFLSTEICWFLVLDENCISSLTAILDL